MIDTESISREVLDALERGWNAGSGEQFPEPFRDDADFVDIRGDHHQGKEAIAAGHQGIFGSIYRGSSLRYQLTDARTLAETVILLHSTAELEVPSGPLAGTLRATQSIVLQHDDAAWKIVNFHNTIRA